VAHLTIRQTQRHYSSLGSDPPATEEVHFIQSDRKREELQGWFGYCLRPHGRTIFRLAPRTARITRCDLMQVFQLNLEDREYTTWPLQAYPSREELLVHAAAAPQNVERREPTVLVETETVDTGERKEFFGRTARHVITTRRVLPVQGAKRESSKTVTDGWYIDLETHISCDPWWQSTRSGHAFLTVHKEGEEGDVPTFTDIGEPERGYVVLSNSTSHATLTLPDGSTKEHVSIAETAVTHLSTAELDPKIFEIPAGFQLVETLRQDPNPPLSIRWKQAYDRLARRFRGKS
jgi:hypothetical protein